jgi:transcriptional regulatory protein GAL4
MGEWVSGSGAEEGPSLFYEAARSLLKPEVLESGSINNVQAFLILGNYLQKTDRPNTGYNYLGIALRLAMGLGLHHELPTSSPATPIKRHRRRVLFWVLYCFDSWFNITTGRPSLLSDANFDVRMPQNAEEEGNDGSGTLVDTTSPTSCSVIIALARLTKIANKVYNGLICASSCADVDHQTVVMEQLIQNWQSALPAYMTTDNTHVPAWFLGPRQTVYWKAANLRILLLLASQRHRADDFEKLAVGSRCQTIAASSIGDIATFCERYPEHLHSGLAWYAVYFTLQAMLSFTSQCVYRRRIDPQLANVDSQQYETTASLAVSCIEGLQAKNTAAGRAYRIVHRLRDVVRQLSGAMPLDANLQAGLNSYGASQSADGQAFNHGINQMLGPQDPPTDPASIPLDFDQAIPNLVLAEWGNAADLSLHSLFNGMDDFGTGDFYG